MNLDNQNRQLTIAGVKALAGFAALSG